MLRRRVNKLRGNNAAFLAIARRRDELKRSEVAARENKVTLMRKYRTGELPDVQRVTVAAFLAPLGDALLQGILIKFVIEACFAAVKPKQHLRFQGSGGAGATHQHALYLAAICTKRRADVCALRERNSLLHPISRTKVI